jgi:aryl-alcohol dehydrogenase-like predicted oxidoreductase
VQYRILGKTNPRVSEISLGAWSLGGLIRVRNRTSQDADPCGNCEVSEAEGIRMAHRALALGINFFDTAPIYGDGGSELRVRIALETSAARDVIVSAKCGVFAQD